jgi:N,N'-diacetyllegionaminate synthase
VVGNIKIGTRLVGPGEPCFVIAEAGVNHNGDMEMARELVRVAARSGADAVKFQTFKAEDLATENAPKAEYQKSGGSALESQQEMLRRLELSEEDHHELMALSQEEGIVFMSSPFDDGSADLLGTLGIPAIKIPSGEITNIPFLRRLSAMRMPLILSTGMADLVEVTVAVSAIRESGNPPLALLHCVSNYPADPADCNLHAMRTLVAAFNVPVGFSDHTDGGTIALAAVALGACVIEKHFTLDRDLPGPDHKASLDPTQLRDYVQNIRSVESSLGNGIKKPVPSELETAAVARKSVVAAVAIQKGTRLESGMLAVRRPGTGLPPSSLPELIGRCALYPIAKGNLLRHDQLS